MTEFSKNIANDKWGIGYAGFGAYNKINAEKQVLKAIVKALTALSLLMLLFVIYYIIRESLPLFNSIIIIFYTCYSYCNLFDLTRNHTFR